MQTLSIFRVVEEFNHCDSATAVAWKENVIQPGTGFTTKPGVAATRRTPGCDELRSKPHRGFTRSAANVSGDCGTPFRVQTPDVDRNPGCAAPRRPWAVLWNPDGVFKILNIVVAPGLYLVVFCRNSGAVQFGSLGRILNHLVPSFLVRMS